MLDFRSEERKKIVVRDGENTILASSERRRSTGQGSTALGKIYPCDDFGLSILASLDALPPNPTIVIIGLADATMFTCAIANLVSPHVIIVDAQQSILDRVIADAAAMDVSEHVSVHNFFVSSEGNALKGGQYLIVDDNIVQVPREKVKNFSSLWNDLLGSNVDADLLLLNCGGCEANVLRELRNHDVARPKYLAAKIHKSTLARVNLEAIAAILPFRRGRYMYSEEKMVPRAHWKVFFPFEISCVMCFLYQNQRLSRSPAKAAVYDRTQIKRSLEDCNEDEESGRLICTVGISVLSFSGRRLSFFLVAHWSCGISLGAPKIFYGW